MEEEEDDNDDEELGSSSSSSPTTCLSSLVPRLLLPSELQLFGHFGGDVSEG